MPRRTNSTRNGCRKIRAWGGGWIGWADLYSRFAPQDQTDPAKAERILKDGLAVSDVERRQHLVERLAGLYEETGQMEKAASLRDEQASANAAEPSPEGRAIKTQEREKGGPDPAVDAEATAKRPEKLRPTAPAEDAWDVPAEPATTIRNTGPKAGRNAPCPCGSGKKFKKCCGTK